MDLTSGTPLWPIADGLPAVYPRLHHDLRCDLAIIGGGITGALVAHRFAREGIRTCLLEAGEVGHGSTAATTALIQYEIDTHLLDLIEELAGTAGDGCGWRSTKSLYLATRRSDRRMLEREQLARRPT